MPNRILRDWTDSFKINDLDANAERFFVRLMMKVDDYGCYLADSRLLRASLYPLLLDKVREADIARWMAECQKANIVRLYEIEGKKYVQILEFGQRLDRAKSKYPQPTANDPREITRGFPPEVEVEVEVETESEVEKKDLVFFKNSNSDLSLNENLKKEKEKSSEKKEKVIPPWDTPEFENLWELYKRFRKEQHKFTFASSITEQAALKELSEISKGQEVEATKIINQTFTKGWRGLFPIKNEINGSNQTRSIADKVKSSFAMVDEYYSNRK